MTLSLVHHTIYTMQRLALGGHGRYGQRRLHKGLAYLAVFQSLPTKGELVDFSPRRTRERHAVVVKLLR